MTDTAKISIEIPSEIRGDLALAALNTALGYVTKAARLQIESKHYTPPVDASAWDEALYVTPDRACAEIAQLKARFEQMQTIVTALDGEVGGTWTPETHWQYEMSLQLPLARDWYENLKQI